MKRYALLTVAMATLFLLLFAVVEALEVPLLTDPGPWLAGNRTLAGATGLALLVADVVLPVPASLVMIANGALFGLVLGTMLSLAGATLSAAAGFALGRRGGPLLSRLVAEDERERANALLERWGELAVLLTRPVPIVAESVAILAGTSPRLSWRRFLVAAAAGSGPAALLYAATGALAVSLDHLPLIFGLVLAVSGTFWLAGRWSNARRERRESSTQVPRRKGIAT